MEVTRDIVIDLMPLYESGEASRDTRAVVEEFLRRDPSLAGLATPDVAAVTSPALTELERRTIEKTRATIRQRSWILALAILCMLLPFSFAFLDGQIRFFMLRDVPESALLFVGAAAFWWMYGRLTRSLRHGGL